MAKRYRLSRMIRQYLGIGRNNNSPQSVKCARPIAMGRFKGESPLADSYIHCPNGQALTEDVPAKAVGSGTASPSDAHALSGSVK